MPHCGMRHCHTVNNQTEPFGKVGAMKRLSKPCISEESRVFVSW